MRAGVRGARALVCAILVLAAYGWLDVLRHVPGPRLALVLPLRANGGGDDVSVLAVLLVFASTFAAIAWIAPPRASRPIRSALVRGVLVAAITVAVGALQQGLVEQSRPSFDWGSALSLAWPWLAALAAGLGTLAATPSTRRHPVAPPCQSPLTPPTIAAEPHPREATLV